MANRPTGFGLTKELQEKRDAKYSPEDEVAVVGWINAVTGESPGGSGRDAIFEWLKDGQVLCRLMEKINPGSIPKYNTSKMAFKQMENTSLFLNAAEKYGVIKTDLFQTVDLYEGENMAQVLSTLIKLSGVAAKKGYAGPSIGVRESDKNLRDFDEQKLREGRNVIGLQMGTNQVDSQKGMTPYGLGRQIVNQ